jgi:hypothetical protein
LHDHTRYTGAVTRVAKDARRSSSEARSPNSGERSAADGDGNESPADDDDDTAHDATATPLSESALAQKRAAETKVQGVRDCVMWRVTRSHVCVHVCRRWHVSSRLQRRARRRVV